MKSSQGRYVILRLRVVALFNLLAFSYFSPTSLTSVKGGISTIAGLFVSWVLFEAMYLVVPNRRMSFRHSWPGALLAALAVRAYFFLFPYYVTHFLSDYAGTIGFTIIFLFFFYYFALILLSGAEINALFAEGIPATSENLAGIVQDYTSPPSTGN